MKQSVMTREDNALIRRERWRRTCKSIRRMWPLYVFLLLPVLQVAIFQYGSMYGLQIAFKDFSPRLGILESPWNNFEHFRTLFNSAGFWRAFRNTLYINVLKMLFSFPAPIILALLLNEVRFRKFKRVTQSISYLPTFVSWVVLTGIIFELLSTDRGPVNYIIKALTGHTVDFFTNGPLFVVMLIVSNVWQTVGWNSVIYLAGLSSVDPALYEAADIDGANRFQKAMCISIPSIAPVITIMLILGLGKILEGGFDQILNMYNPLVMEYADILDTYVYRMGIENAQYDFSTAVGLFKNVIGLILVLSTNAIVKKFSDYGIW